MNLSKATKVRLLEQKISVDDLKRWDAFTILVDAKQRLTAYHNQKLGIGPIKRPEDFLRWVGLGRKSSRTMAEVLKSRLNPHFVLWAVLRPELIPPGVLHLWAVRLCQEFHERLRNESVFVDPRYAGMLEVKRRWAKRKASLGELYHVQREASQALVESARIGDSRAVAAGAATHAALDEDPRESVLRVFEAVDEVYSVKTENRQRLASLREALS